MKKYFVYIGLALVLSIDVGDARCDIQYTITDLGDMSLGGSYGSNITSMNASGQIVGYSYITGNTTRHAFLYSNGTMTDIGTLGGTYSYANCINDSGQIVGRAAVPNNKHYHAFLYSNGTMTDLEEWFSCATGINASGQITGYVPNYASFTHAFLYSNGTMTDIGTLGGTYSFAYDINDSGQIVGDSDGHGYATHAFLYSNGIWTNLGTLCGSDSYAESYAKHINNCGQVVGYSDSPSDTTHAFLYSNGTMTDIGTLGGSESYANCINDSGQIVGDADTTGNTVRHAFLYRDGTMNDLNDLIPPSPRWELYTANAINDNGWIAGWGSNSLGETHAYLLKPIPEPSTLVLLGIGAISLVSYALRRLKVV